MTRRYAGMCAALLLVVSSAGAQRVNFEMVPGDRRVEVKVRAGTEDLVDNALYDIQHCAFDFNTNGCTRAARVDLSGVTLDGRDSYHILGVPNNTGRRLRARIDGDSWPPWSGVLTFIPRDIPGPAKGAIQIDPAEYLADAQFGLLNVQANDVPAYGYLGTLLEGDDDTDIIALGLGADDVDVACVVGSQLQGLRLFVFDEAGALESDGVDDEWVRLSDASGQYFLWVSTDEQEEGDYSVVCSESATVLPVATAGVTVSPTLLTITEGEDAEYTVVLTSPPSADVTVTVTLPSDSGVTVDPTSLTFTDALWNTAQTVTVTAVDDDEAVAWPPVTITHSAAGGDYDSVSVGPVTVTVTDDDTAGVTVDPMSLTITEGASDTYTVVLTSEPSVDVTVTVTLPSHSGVTVDPTSLTFNSTTWLMAETVTVTAVDDDEAVAWPPVTITHSAAGGDYDSVSVGPVTVTVTDDDTAGVTVDPMSLTITEGGSDTYTVVLTSEPSVDVTVTVTLPSDSGLTVNPTSLTFNSKTWLMAETVTVTAVDDDEAVAWPPVTITHSAAGGDYDSVSVGPVTVSVTDDDTAGAQSSVVFEALPGDRMVEILVTEARLGTVFRIRDLTYDIEYCELKPECAPGEDVIVSNVTLNDFDRYHIRALTNDARHHVRVRINGETAWTPKQGAVPRDIPGPDNRATSITPSEYRQAGLPVVGTDGRPVYGYLGNALEGGLDTDIIALSFANDEDDVACFVESLDIRLLHLLIFRSDGERIDGDPTPGNLDDDPNLDPTRFFHVPGVTYGTSTGFPGAGVDDGWAQFFNAPGVYFLQIKIFYADEDVEGEYGVVCREIPDPAPPTESFGTYSELGREKAVDLGLFTTAGEIVAKDVLLTSCAGVAECTRNSERSYFYLEVPPKVSVRDPDPAFVVSAISEAAVGVRIIDSSGEVIASNIDSGFTLYGNQPVVPLTTLLPGGVYYVEVVEGNTYRGLEYVGKFSPTRLYVKYQPDLPGSVPERAVELPMPEVSRGRYPAEAIFAGDIYESDGTADEDYFLIDVKDIRYPDSPLGDVELDGTFIAVEAVTREKTDPDDILSELAMELLDEDLAVVPGTYIRYLYPVPRLDRQVNSANLTSLVGEGRYYLRVTRGAGRDAFPYAIQLNQVPLVQLYHEFCSEQLGSDKFSDPIYGCAWHLNSARTGVEPMEFQAYTSVNMNVEPAWEIGYDGEGIVVAVVDSGLDDLHPDLKVERHLNYNFGDPRDLPNEDRRNVFVPTSSHGTNSAGVAAATGNAIGTRGVAPQASVFGVNLLSNPSSVISAHEADAMAIHMEHAAVNTNSWGYRNALFHPMGRAFELAIEEGINVPWANSNHRGYRGRGVSYLFAAGNRHEGDSSTTLEELSSFFGTMTICAVAPDGYRAAYSELGASLWVCGLSGADRLTDESDRSLFSGVPTTSIFGTYLLQFSGTSAATPVVAGVVALMRQANPELTWRDIKLILAETARRMEPSPERYVDPYEGGLYREHLSAWQTGARKYRGSGSYQFSYEYGFGLADAAAAVDMAKDWPLLPAFTRDVYSEKTPYSRNEVADPATTVTVELEAENDVLDFIEYVDVEVSWFSEASRDLNVRLVHLVDGEEVSASELVWPSVDVSMVEVGAEDLHFDYRFGTARHLGEDPKGKWLVEFSAPRASSERRSVISGVELTFYGHKKGTAPSPVPPLPADADEPDADDADDPDDSDDPDADDEDEPDDSDGDPGDGRTGSGACIYETPYWSDTPGFSAGGGFVVSPTNGRSAEIERICGTRRRVETLFARDDGLIVQITGKLRCPNGGVARFTGIEPGGWYFKYGEQNSAGAPLMCSDLPSGKGAAQAGGLTYDVKESGTLVHHSESGLIGIVPHIAASSCPSPDGDFFDEYVTPYWHGHGGIVVEASGPVVVVKVKCEEDEETQHHYPDEDGIVAALVRPDFCKDPHGNPRLGTVRVQGAKPGGWYWVSGDITAAVAPLVCEDQLGGFLPANPGGLDVLRDKWGSFFTYAGGKSIAIIPHLEDNE